MAGHKSLLDAVKEGDVRIIELTRKQARDLMNGDEAVIDLLQEDLDEVQGEADEEGKASYLVLKINGTPL